MPSIPKKVHYCWFGKNEKPKSVIDYIDNWKSKLPDYEIIEWNEDNFDINICKYTKEAYNEKKYAFVSDYARLWALYHHGGIYLDTDVEVVNKFDEYLTEDLVLGFEEFDYIATSTILAKKQALFIKKWLDSYHLREFIINGKPDLTTNVECLTDFLIELGLNKKNLEQEIMYKEEKIIILNAEYLSPYDYANNIDNRTINTLAVHHFGQTWSSKYGKLKRKVKQLIISCIGNKNLKKI